MIDQRAWCAAVLILATTSLSAALHGGPTGACCDRAGSCVEVTEAECIASGGEYQGDGTVCEAATCVGVCCVDGGACLPGFMQSFCEDVIQGVYAGNGTACEDPGICETFPQCPGEGSCLQPNGTPGCDVEDCCNAVCAVDISCCSVSWNLECVNQAAQLCVVDCPGEGDCCQANGSPGCDDTDCCGDVCAVDPNCCLAGWDDQCATLAADLCGALCTPVGGACCLDGGACLPDVMQPFCEDVIQGVYAGDGSTCETFGVCETFPQCPGEGSCLAPNGTPGCEVEDCCNAVCAVDVSCCSVSWNLECVNQAAQLCVVDCPGAGDCCQANGSPGCDDTDCCGAVCATDPNCCLAKWDEVCATLAGDLCGALCGETGACCVDGGGCQSDVTQSFCEDVFQGIYAGNGTTCEDPGICETFPQCPGEGSCLEPNGTPGCDVEDCCNAVCAVDISCCTSNWDLVCVSQAAQLCKVVDCPGEGDCCEANGSPGCDDTDCCGDVCAVDPNCCLADWDEDCAALAADLCIDVCSGETGACCLDGECMPFFSQSFCEDDMQGIYAGDGTACDDPGVCETFPQCPGEGSCLEQHGTPGCEVEDCCNAVCAADVSCCSVGWDEACVSQAARLCVAECPGTGDCCQANGSPGCDDTDCCEAVCDVDPNCCVADWDELCATSAGALCGPLCDATGACCDPVGGCSQTTQEECGALGGTYQGDGVLCGPDTCPTCTIEGPGLVCAGQQAIAYSVIVEPPIPGAETFWVIAGDATFCDGSEQSEGEMVCVNADAVCTGSFQLQAMVIFEGGILECGFAVDVNDVEPPNLVVPPDIAVECEPSSLMGALTAADPSNTGEATSIDDCDPGPTVTFSDVISGSCPITIVRTWTSTDTCGNSTSDVQNIELQDLTPPTVIAPDDAALECNQSTAPSNTGTATVADLCDPAPDVSFSDSVMGECPTTIERTWTGTDWCGNSATAVQIITVNDTIAPKIKCPPDVTVECEADVPPPDVAQVQRTDTCTPPEDLVVEFVGDTPLDDPCGGVIQRTFRCTDACGNSRECVQIITVADTTPPVIACPPDATLECPDLPPSPASSLEEFLALGGSVSDNCSGDVSVTHLGDEMRGTCPIVVTRSYRATDGCGNTTDCTRIFTIEDTVPPEVTCPPDDSFECPDDVPAPDTTLVSGTDDCSSVVISHEGDSDNGGAGCEADPLIVTRTYRATDACGNFTDCVQVLTVIDQVSPTVACPDDAQLACEVPTQFTITASDNCPGDLGISCSAVFDPPGSGVFTDLGGGVVEITFAANGTATVMCAASDACGNGSDPCSFTVFGSCLCEIDLEVEGCADPGPPSDSCQGGVVRMTMRYTGDDCSASNNPQEGQAECDDFGPLPDTVFIIANEKSNPNDGKIWFEGTVDIDQEFDVDSAVEGEDELKDNTHVHVFDEQDGVLLQTMKIRTKCDKPLDPGDQFGSVFVTSLTSVDGGTVELPDPDACLTVVRSGPSGVDVDWTYTVTNIGASLIDSATVVDSFGNEFIVGPLESGEAAELVLTETTSETVINTVAVVGQSGPTTCEDVEEQTITILQDCCPEDQGISVLVMQYTADDCTASDNPQGGNAECDDFDPLADPVFIVANDNNNPNDGKIWFSGIVALGETYVIDSAAQGEPKLSNDTRIHVFDESGGTLLQFLKIKTNCSQPLSEGDQFGSALLVNCVSEGGQPATWIPGDATSDGAVDARDLLKVLEDLGTLCETPRAECPADVNGDGVVDEHDLATVVENWGHAARARERAHGEGGDRR